ncbi:hypothetical protein [Streptomyces sp. NPDC059816]|uniref:hypothetical protein n=1 Tax=Streptomyces sp. NPDC059816 TaxID=3346960 RepID=UPI003663082F
MAGLEPYQDELLGTVTDDGSGNWLNLLAAKGFRIHPHAKGVEFEIKYAPRSGAHGELGDYAQRLLAPDGLPEAVLAPSWLVFRDTTVEYWLLDDTEWSKQRTSHRTDVLKRKTHRIYREPITGTPLVQSTEDFLTDPDRIAAALGDFDGSAGMMHKSRAKGHYVHLAAGIVFNLVESRCRTHETEQIQLELEYGAHLHHKSQTPAPACTHAVLRTHLWWLHHLLKPRFDEAGLAPTIERKRDFVQAVRDQHT